MVRLESVDDGGVERRAAAAVRRYGPLGWTAAGWTWSRENGTDRPNRSLLLQWWVGYCPLHGSNYQPKLRRSGLERTTRMDLIQYKMLLC